MAAITSTAATPMRFHSHAHRPRCAAAASVPSGFLPAVDVGATEFRGAAAVFVPAPVVEVVEPIGAGDAFAAGYLSGFLAGDTGETCSKLGHVMAAHALRNTDDSPIPPGIAVLRELAERAGDTWNRVAFTGSLS
jgi:2-dehydro-3-deoxygluconokinase